MTTDVGAGRIQALLESDEHIAQFFRYGHLPEALSEISKPFAILAGFVIQTCHHNPERTVCLRKLLEAKDAAVRAHIARAPSPG